MMSGAQAADALFKASLTVHLVQHRSIVVTLIIIAQTHLDQFVLMHTHAAASQNLAVKSETANVTLFLTGSCYLYVSSYDESDVDI